MASQPQPSSREDFGVALVCALRLEFDAICLAMDEFWDNEGDRYGKAPGDRNTYTTGRIGKHNVVVTLLGMGKANSSRAAGDLRSSYPNVKLAILVGICGGVPFIGEQQVRFGDVVISGTAVEYDFGRQTELEFIRRDTLKASLGTTPKDILNLLASLDTDLGKARLQKRTAVLFDQLQRTAIELDRGARYRDPYTAADRVWTTTPVKHEYQEDAKLRRPTIFLGPMASGDTLMMSVKHRDRLVQAEGVIAFEMEAAGVWQELPLIIIKGVCDYADGEKTKAWQDFAAATAAATSKAVLERYVQTDRQGTTVSAQLSTARQGGSLYTHKVEASKDVNQGNEMEVSSSQPPRNYVQQGSQFVGDIRADGNVKQGNKMAFF